MTSGPLKPAHQQGRRNDLLGVGHDVVDFQGLQASHVNLDTTLSMAVARRTSIHACRAQMCAQSTMEHTPSFTLIARRVTPLGTSPFYIQVTCSRFSTTLSAGYCRRIAALAAAVAAAAGIAVALVVAAALPVSGKCIIKCAECFYCTILSVRFSFFLTISSPLPLRLNGSLRPVVIASLFGCPSGCWPRSSTASRRPQVWSAVYTDSLGRFSTMSCVYSTRHSLHALNSFPSSSLQRICVVISSSPSCPSWAFPSLVCLSRSS